MRISNWSENNNYLELRPRLILASQQLLRNVVASKSGIRIWDLPLVIPLSHSDDTKNIWIYKYKIDPCVNCKYRGWQNIWPANNFPRRLCTHNCAIFCERFFRRLCRLSVRCMEKKSHGMCYTVRPIPVLGENSSFVAISAGKWYHKMSWKSVE